MNDDANEFYCEKIRILKEYVSTGEELLSNIEKWESLAEILEERDALIEKLQKLEMRLREENSLTFGNEEQKRQISELIKLNSQIDQDIIRQIQEEKNKTIQDIKINHEKQRIASYEINTTPNYGNHLDTKK